MARYISERHAQEAMSTLICDCIRDKKIPTYDDIENALLTCPTADVTERKANNFDIHNVEFTDKDYPLPMLLVDGKENYSLISLDGVILVPLCQVIDKLMCVKPDEVLRNGKRICPNCGQEMLGGDNAEIH